MVVNPEARPIKPKAWLVCARREEAPSSHAASHDGRLYLDVKIGEIPPQCAHEVTFEEEMSSLIPPQECSWGLLRAATLCVGERQDASTSEPDARPISVSVREGSSSSECQFYIMYRDALTKRPLSVCAL